MFYDKNVSQKKMDNFEFKVLGHACLFIKYKNIRLLIDPWLIGSTYWRSWWNYPKVEESILNYLANNYGQKSSSRRAPLNILLMPNNPFQPED